MSKAAEIIRGDDQTITVPVADTFGNITGGTAYLFVVPKTAGVSDVIDDPAAIIKCVSGPFTSTDTSFKFVLKSTTGTGSTLVPVGTYGWYGRFKNAAGLVTTFRMDSLYVEVTAPKGDY